MKLLPYIKINVLSFMRESKIAIISFLLFPMMMAYIYGVMQADAFSGKNSFQPIKVEFKYDKLSQQGEILTSILNNESVKSFIEVKSEEPDCRVTISDAFDHMKIQKLKGTENKVKLVKSLMETISESLNQYKVIATNVNRLQLNAKDKEELINKLVLKMSESSKEAVVSEKLVEGYRNLSAREYYTISMFSFTSIMLVTVLVKNFYKEKKLGVVRRSFSTPNSRGRYLAGYLGSSFIIALMINLIYIVINRVLGIAFADKLLALLMLALVQSLLQAAVVGTMISIIKTEEIVNPIMTALIIIPCIIGGIFYNIDIIEIKIFKVFSTFSPNSLILNSYKNLSIGQSIYGARNEIIISLLLSFTLLSISFIKVKASWED